ERRAAIARDQRRRPHAAALVGAVLVERQPDEGLDAGQEDRAVFQPVLGVEREIVVTRHALLDRRGSRPAPGRYDTGAHRFKQRRTAVAIALCLMIEGQEGLTWERWRRLARAAEDGGFESLFRSDHLTGLSGDPKRPSLDTWASLTWLASNTSRIRFGPLVCPLTFHHPALLAKRA